MTFKLNRDEIARVFDTPRAIKAFERMQEAVAVTEEVVTAAIGPTGALNEGTFVTLSPNDELPNERVLAFGSGLAYTLTATQIIIRLSANVPIVTGGFRVQFVAAGDSVVAVPLMGILATRDDILAAAGSQSIRTITATATPAAGDYTLLVDASGGPVTINLPPAASSSRRVIVAKKIDASANAMTLDGSGAETIDGAATQTTATQWVAFTIQCNGVGWFII